MPCSSNTLQFLQRDIPEEAARAANNRAAVVVVAHIAVPVEVVPAVPAAALHWAPMVDPLMTRARVVHPESLSHDLYSLLVLAPVHLLYIGMLLYPLGRGLYEAVFFPLRTRAGLPGRTTQIAEAVSAPAVVPVTYESRNVPEFLFSVHIPPHAIAAILP